MGTNTDEVKRHYDENPKKEWDRLKEGNPYEFWVTTAWMDRYLKTGDSILDVGGGPGRYSIHYARKGHPVTLLDLSPANVAYAKKKARQYKTRISALQGNALDLSMFPDGSFDAVFLMGPLYHLLEEKERERAINEAVRVCKRGGRVFLAFIAMSGGMIHEMREDPSMALSPLDAMLYDDLIRGLPYAGVTFTAAYFATRKDIEALVSRIEGTKQIAFFGQESVPGPCCHNILACPKSVRDRWLDIAIALSDQPDYLAFSEHWVSVLKKI